MKTKNAIVIDGVVYRLRRATVSSDEMYSFRKCDELCKLRRRCGKKNTFPCELFPKVKGKTNYFDIEPFEYKAHGNDR